jgi:hypothetical protein
VTRAPASKKPRRALDKPVHLSWDGSRFELLANTKSGSVCVARVRDVRTHGVKQAFGNAQRLMAGWNILQSMRTEDIAAAMRLADSPALGRFDPALARIVAAVAMAAREAFHTPDPEKEKP